MKRVYRTVAVATVQDGFSITLDGRPVRTPGRAALVLPGRALAEAVAAEWDAQQGKVNPASMPIMQCAATAIDRVAPNHAEVAQLTARYGETDLTCHRADHPQGLQDRQAAGWDPLLDWLADSRAIRLLPVAGLFAVRQDQDGLQRLERELAGLDAFRLAGISAATGCLGSVVLALALADGRLDADEAFRLSRIDEDWQAERWGLDAEEAARASRLAEEIRDLARFLSLLDGD